MAEHYNVTRFGGLTQGLGMVARHRPGQDKRFETLRRAGQLINSSLDLGEVLDHVIDTLIEATGAERGFIMLTGPRGRDVEFQVARNLAKEAVESPSFHISRSVVSQVCETLEPVLIADAVADARYKAFQSVAQLRLRSVLCVPLVERARLVGVVYLDNHLRRGQFDEDDLVLGQAIADLSAVAIENARLYQGLNTRMAEVQSLKEYQDNVFRSVSSAVISIDREGRIRSANLAAELLLGPRSKGSREGEAYTSAFGDDLSSRLLPLMARAMAPERRREPPREFGCSLPDRGDVSLRISVAPLEDAAGSILGVVLVIDDLTEFKRLEEARRQERAEKERIHQIFGKYVPEKVVAELMSNPAALELGGKLQEVTILFADIRGYTALSERMSPTDIVQALNKYLAIGTKSILERQGTLDKYMGDAVMAIFNAPLTMVNHSLAAVLAALDMQIAVHEADGDPVLVRYGVGINTGLAVVGNVGTEVMMNYTAIGDAVNVAQRLQSLAGPGEILLGESCYRLVSPWVRAEPLEALRVKGRSEPVPCFRLLGTRKRAESPPGLDMTRHLPVASDR